MRIQTGLEIIVPDFARTQLQINILKL